MRQKEFAAQTCNFVRHFFSDPAKPYAPKEEVTEHFFGSTPEFHLACYTGSPLLRVAHERGELTPVFGGEETIMLYAGTNKRAYQCKFQSKIEFEDDMVKLDIDRKLGIVAVVSVTKNRRAATLDDVPLIQPNPGKWFGDLLKIRPDEFPAKDQAPK